MCTHTPSSHSLSSSLLPSTHVHTPPSLPLTLSPNLPLLLPPSLSPPHALSPPPIHTHLGEYEMILLESTLEKITSLLRVGFGEAGAGIIRANLNMQGKYVYVCYCSVCVCVLHFSSCPLFIFILFSLLLSI